MSKISSFKLCGLTSAPFTPMTDTGEVNYDRIDAYSKHLADNEIRQVFVNGTTGEGLNLTLEERKKIVEKWMEVGRKTRIWTHLLHMNVDNIVAKGEIVMESRQTALVVHVGALHISDAQELARHAATVGADGFSTIPPLYYKPNSLDMLITYCQQVAAAAPHLPFYYYHIPGMTGVSFSIEAFLKKAQAKIPSLAGIKFSCCDMVDLTGALNVKAPHRDDGRFNIVYGMDDAIIAGMCTGADGGIGGAYNIMAGIFKRLMSNIENGEMADARKEQYRIQQLCNIVHKYGALLGNNVASLKACMTVVGFDCGPARTPLRSMTEEEMTEFKKELEGIGFFDWYK